MIKTKIMVVDYIEAHCRICCGEEKFALFGERRDYPKHYVWLGTCLKCGNQTTVRAAKKDSS